MEHQVAETERDGVALPVRMGGLGLVNPVNQSRQEYEASIKATGLLLKQIANQAAEPPNDEDVASAQLCTRQEKADSARRDQEYVTTSLPLKTLREVEFIKEKDASSWLSVLPLKEMNFTLNKKEFRDAIKLRYGLEFNNIPTVWFFLIIIIFIIIIIIIIIVIIIAVGVLTGSIRARQCWL